MVYILLPKAMQPFKGIHSQMQTLMMALDRTHPEITYERHFLDVANGGMISLVWALADRDIS
jgi:hypothetical protein